MAKLMVNEATGRVMARLPDFWSGQAPPGCRIEDGPSGPVSGIQSAEDAERDLASREERLREREARLEAWVHDKARELRRRELALEKREASERRRRRGFIKG